MRVEQVRRQYLVLAMAASSVLCLLLIGGQPLPPRVHASDDLTVASAPGGLHIPSSGLVLDVFLDTPSSDTWFPSYDDYHNVLQPAPAGGVNSGVDIGQGTTPCKYPVVAAGPGVVWWQGLDLLGGNGWSVVVKHPLNGGLVYTWYSSLGTSLQSCFTSKLDHNVNPGTPLGFQGTTGSTAVAPYVQMHWIILRQSAPLPKNKDPFKLIPSLVPASPNYYACLPLDASGPTTLLGKTVSIGAHGC
jgi:murein DD-endopeptidase MepM/ murein hydrolase activator NlpD